MRKNNLYAVSIYGEDKQFPSTNQMKIDKSVRTYSILAFSKLEALGCAIEQFRKETNKSIDCWSVEFVNKDTILRVISD